MTTSPAQLDGPMLEVSALGPSAPQERIAAIDALRGFALLGILIVNIRLFANIDAVYFNPLAAGPLSRADLAVWWMGELLAESKFMTLFSMLFGVGVVLMYERRRQAGLPTARVHYRRMLGLFIIGMAHAYVIWHADILVPYAVCGCMVFLFRRWRAGWLITAGLGFLLIGTGLIVLFHLSLPFWSPADQQEFQVTLVPSASAIADEIRVHRGSWLEQMPRRAEDAVGMQIFLMAVWIFWRVTGLMLIGMGLFKVGVLSGRADRRVYVGLLLAAVLVGLPLILLGLWLHPAIARGEVGLFFIGTLPNYWGSILLALGYAAGVMLLCRVAVPRWLGPLAAVGRTALSNYLLQSLICTFLFYGHGFGLFGRVSWTGQVGIVVLIWAGQLAASSVYLRHFRMGPMEAAWRAFTYWRWPTIVE